MVRWGGGRGFAHLDHHRDVRLSRTEDHCQNRYENHPTTSIRVESEAPTSRERLVISGIMAYFVEKGATDYVWLYKETQGPLELVLIGERE